MSANIFFDDMGWMGWSSEIL